MVLFSLFFSLRLELLVRSNAIVNSFQAVSTCFKIILQKKLYQNYTPIKFYGRFCFPCQEWGLWFLFIFSIWLSQINYILIYFCNFYNCKSLTLFSYVHQPFIFLLSWTSCPCILYVFRIPIVGPLCISSLISQFVVCL